MSEKQVIETVDAFVAAVNRGDLDAAINYYEPDALFVAQPGATAIGRSPIRAALAQLSATGAKVATHARTALVAGDLALYVSRWELQGTASENLTAESADVLRRAPDGQWRIAIDNPWGGALLGLAART